jgi:nitrite reductase/ring-hydroxylating ferredoxin subunit
MTPIRTAYDRPLPTSDDEIVRVGKGTPGGEFMRRYWHPVAVASEVGNLPQRVRVLGEDLVLFRLPTGEFGLVHPRCAHRGTSLYYGKVESDGIRCCYHGWLFSPRGECLDQPCEPEGGKARQVVRQPWYPVREQYGLVFAYLGPYDQMPEVPRYDVLEGLTDTQYLHPDGNSVGSGGPKIMPCNWLQTHENVMDGYHVPILHGRHSGNQFSAEMAVMPKTSWDVTPYGMTETKVRAVDGGTITRVLEVVLPTIRIVADPTLSRMGRSDNVAWTLPVDDTTTRIFTVFKLPKGVVLPKTGTRKMYGGRSWAELDEEGHQRFPGDFEAQVSQGPITLHSEEHLVGSDRGVAMFRRMLRREIRKVQAGENPVLAGPDAKPLIEVRAVNERTSPATHEAAN